MRVLVTGARGFVGKAIVEKLREEKVEVIELHRRRYNKENTSDKNSDKPPVCKFVVDITNKEEVLSLANIGRIDAVVHSAGLAHQFGDTKSEDFTSVNINGTENILELGKLLKIKHFILLSSVSVYGNVLESGGYLREINEDAECNPKDFYAVSKFESEKSALKICGQSDYNLTILRLATVIGEEDRGNFLRLIKSIDKRRFLWVGKGINFKSLIYREDVAGAIWKILYENLSEESEKNRETIEVNKTEIFNASAEPLNMREIVETISGELKKSVIGISINEKLLRFFFALNSATISYKKIGTFQKTVEKWLADDAYSAQNLCIRYKYKTAVSAKDAIRREVKWYLQQ